MGRISESESLDTRVDKMTAEKGKLTFKLLLLVLSIAVGNWFGIGYTFTSTNSPQNFIVQWIRSVKCARLASGNETSDGVKTNGTTNIWCKLIGPEEEGNMLAENGELSVIWGISGCMFAFGAFASCWFTNVLVGRFGNKGSLLFVNVVALLGAVLNGISVYLSSYELFILSRFLLGCHGGISIAVVPMYISEVSPANLRGALGSIPGLTLVTGSLVSVFMGLPQLLGTASMWPIVFYLRLVPAALNFITLPFCPESPRYLLLVKHEKNEARKALVWLRGTEDVSSELKTIQSEESDSTSQQIVSVIGLFKDPFLRKVTLVGMIFLAANQFSGIAGILIYTTAIFKGAGFSDQVAMYGTLGTMLLQIVAVFLSMILLDRAGRKVLMLASCYACVMLLFCLTGFMLLVNNGLCSNCTYGTLGSMLTFMLVFNVGPAFVPWVLLSEMYSQSSRGAGMMIATAVCNGAGVPVALLFPVLDALIGPWVFTICGGIMLLCTVYLNLKMIETKGKDIGEIQDELRRKLM